MTTIVGGICPRCGQFHDLFLAVDGSIVCRNADGTAERIRQLEAERDAARADERERIVAELEGPARESEAMYAHAEAVAAKLVEVIRVDDLRLRTQKGHTAQARRERDAARAEVAALREQWKGSWAANIRREVLADLRTKVNECSTVGEVLALFDGEDRGEVKP